jgi:hypothetical protein
MKQLVQFIIINGVWARDDKTGAAGLAVWCDGRRYDLRTSRRAPIVLGGSRLSDTATAGGRPAI